MGGGLLQEGLMRDVHLIDFDFRRGCLGFAAEVLHTRPGGVLGWTALVLNLTLDGKRFISVVSDERDELERDDNGG